MSVSTSTEYPSTMHQINGNLGSNKKLERAHGVFVRNSKDPIIRQEYSGIRLQERTVQDKAKRIIELNGIKTLCVSDVQRTVYEVQGLSRNGTYTTLFPNAIRPCVKREILAEKTVKEHSWLKSTPTSVEEPSINEPPHAPVKRQRPISQLFKKIFSL